MQFYEPKSDDLVFFMTSSNTEYLVYYNIVLTVRTLLICDSHNFFNGY